MNRFGRAAVGVATVSALGAGVLACGDDAAEPLTNASASAIPGDPPASSQVPTVTQSPASQTPAAPTTSASKISVNAGPSPQPGTERVQLWADDVAAGRIADIQRKCWTVSPQTVALRYADSAAIRAIVATPAIYGQVGMLWRSSAGSVTATWAELKSSYPCPVVTTPATADHNSRSEDAIYLVKRALLRAVGRPVNPADTEASYRLTCTPYGSWEQQLGHPAVTSVAAAIGPIRTFDEATLRATPEGEFTRVSARVDDRERTLLVAPEQGGLCIPEVTG